MSSCGSWLFFFLQTVRRKTHLLRYKWGRMWGPRARSMCMFICSVICRGMYSGCAGRTHGKHYDMWKKLGHRCSLMCTCTSAKRGLSQPPLPHYPGWGLPTGSFTPVLRANSAKLMKPQKWNSASQSWVPADEETLCHWDGHSTAPLSSPLAFTLQEQSMGCFSMGVEVPFFLRNLILQIQGIL